MVDYVPHRLSFGEGDNMFPAMSRGKQQLTQQECVALLKQEPRGVLSLMGEDGYPYGLPISYWYCEADGKIYFHGAKSCLLYTSKLVMALSDW